MKGQEIKKRRIALNLSQTELAERFTMSPEKIAQWENEECEPEFAGLLFLAFQALEIEATLNNPKLQQTKARVKAKIQQRLHERRL